MAYPSNVWRNLLRRFPYTVELPTLAAAKAYLALSEARIKHLQQIGEEMDALRFGSYGYVENMILRGIGARVFFIKQNPRVFSNN